jgi:hypothetical protein
MNKSILVTLCLLFSLPSLAQEWGTVFPTEIEIAKLDITYAGKKIIVQNYYYPKPGKFGEVLALRITASKLLKEFGLSGGRIMVTRQTMDRASGKKIEIAAITYQSEYESLEALKKEINSFKPEQSTRFQNEILSKMGLIVYRFKRTSSYVVSE